MNNKVRFFNKEMFGVIFPSRFGLRGLLALALALLGLLCAVPATAQAGGELKIQIIADKKSVGMDGILGLEILISGGSGSIPEPEISDLDLFEIVSKSFGKRVSIVNMSVTSQKTYNFRLRPLYFGKTAKLRATIEMEGKIYSSNTLEVELIKSSGGAKNFQRPIPPPPGGGMFGFDNNFDNFFGRRKYRQDDFILQSNVSASETFVGGEIVYTLSLYRAINIWSKAEFLLPDTEGLWTEQLPEGQRQQTKTETVAGRQYSVNQLSVLLYPLTTGENKIGSGSVRFQPHPLSSPVNLRSKKIIINALPLPNKGKPKNFSGLVGEFSIEADVKEKSVQAGKPVTLTISVTGKGNLQSIPKPVVPVLNGMEIYDPEIKDRFFRTIHGSNGTRSFTYIIVPQKEGEFTIPPFGLNYFDPEKRTYHELKTAAITLKILPGAGSGFLGETGKNFSGRRKNPELFKTDIQHIKPDISELKEEGRPYYERAGFYIYTFGLLLALALYSAYIRNRKRLMGDQGYARSARARRMAKKRLRRAGDFLESSNSDEFYGEMDRALRQYLADKWNITSSSITTDDISGKLGDSNKRVAQNLSRLLGECDSARFSPVTVGQKKMNCLLDEAYSVIEELEGKL